MAIPRKHIFRILAFVLCVSALSCSDDPVSSTGSDFAGFPEKLDDGWQVLPMAFMAVNSEPILRLSDRIAKGEFGDVHSLSIARGDFLVFDEYYNGYGINDVHRVYSVTKSVISALIGIAIDQGYIEGVEEKITDFLPEYSAILAADPVKQTVTLRHLLTMSAGFEWHELSIPYSDPQNSWNLMTTSSDLIRYTLERPIVDEPGTKFVYNSGCSIILGWILKQATGRHADALAEEFLFLPLGITTQQWRHIPANNMPHAASGLSLRPRDMAKLGKLYMDRGKWHGFQVVPQDWVSESQSPHVPVSGSTFYGYQWWSLRYESMPQAGVQKTSNIKFAAGYSGQYILLLPAHDLVVVLTGGNGDDRTNFAEMIFNYILPAVTD